ncbi:hypothetical protein NI420_002905 [Salmonella enterica]|nr:hypothetical protein [Salmonella enterica]HAU3223221.1 hypothetical protein [Salmonella enterica subsp. houtenae]EJJ4248011.1 hypothetical protein [Salmonella enterica]HCL4433957.1 hypothetical protein [Salmonella enterica]HCL5082259.1 hypothetical protein [Salmonella enterica]
MYDCARWRASRHDCYTNITERYQNLIAGQTLRLAAKLIQPLFLQKILDEKLDLYDNHNRYHFHNGST